jgi:hypothetical protein
VSKQYEISITVDENDDDLMSETSIISEDNLSRLRPLISDIKNFETYKVVLRSGSVTQYAHNYPLQDNYTHEGEKDPTEIYSNYSEEDLEFFEGLCPYCEYGFHTVTSVEITPYPVEGREKLL